MFLIGGREKCANARLTPHWHISPLTPDLQHFTLPPIYLFLLIRPDPIADLWHVLQVGTHIGVVLV